MWAPLETSCVQIWTVKHWILSSARCRNLPEYIKTTWTRRIPSYSFYDYLILHHLHWVAQWGEKYTWIKVVKRFRKKKNVYIVKRLACSWGLCSKNKFSWEAYFILLKLLRWCQNISERAASSAFDSSYVYLR